jgi:hypothetical protein
MDMVICAVGLNQASLKVLIDTDKEVSQRLMGGCAQDLAGLQFTKQSKFHASISSGG